MSFGPTRCSAMSGYGAVKKRVGATANDIYEYGAGKDALVQRILEKAGMNERERTSIVSNQVPLTYRT